MAEPVFLEGVPRERVLAALAAADGDEIAAFSQTVGGAAVRFASGSYRQWLGREMKGAADYHARRLLETYDP